MAAHVSCHFYFIAVTFVSIIVSFLTWEHLSQTDAGWSRFSNGCGAAARLVVTNFTVWSEERRPTPPPVVLAPRNKTKIVTPKIKSQVTMPKTKAQTPMNPLSIKSFERLPLWDFEDIYNEGDSPRPKTCKNSLRNTKDRTFTKAFLPNVCLFLHKDNMNVSEWNRLSHFNSPFGFMGYNYEEVMAAVKLIPKPKEPLVLPKPGGDGCVRCAVVGNGGILNGSRMGAEIDAHDYVFRMNGAIIEGHEEDVGKRTSIYLHSAHSIVKSRSLFKKYGYKSAPHDEGIKYVMMPEAMKDYQWLEGLFKEEKIRVGQYRNKMPITYYSGQDTSRFYVLHQDFMRYVRNRFFRSVKLNKGGWAAFRPTNGAFTLFLALQTCDTVNAYGFLTNDYKKYSHYYFQKTIMTKKLSHPHHDYTLEMNLWSKLHESKIMKLYQRSEKKTRSRRQK